MRKGKGKLVYFSEEEWDKIERQSQILGVNSSEYIRRCVNKNIIVNITIPNLNELIFELNKIGTNINQIAHKVNISNSVSRVDLENSMKNIKDIYKLINKELFEKLDKSKKESE